MTGPLIVFALAAALGGASLKYLRRRNRELRAAVSWPDREGGPGERPEEPEPPGSG